jgi:hypothetical protein
MDAEVSEHLPTEYHPAKDAAVTPVDSCKYWIRLGKPTYHDTILIACTAARQVHHHCHTPDPSARCCTAEWGLLV